MFEDPKRGHGVLPQLEDNGGLRLGRGQGQATRVSQAVVKFAFTRSQGKILEGLYLGNSPLFWSLCGMGAWVVPGIS